MIEHTTEGEVLFNGIAVGDLVAEGHSDFWTAIAEGDAEYLPSEARYEPWDGEAVTWDSQTAHRRAVRSLTRSIAKAEFRVGGADKYAELDARMAAAKPLVFEQSKGLNARR